MKDVLPDKLSDLLDAALDDLDAVEADPKYRVDMSRWHGGLDVRCKVCLAGAVMAKRLGAAPEGDFTPAHYPGLVGRQLKALDWLRMGNVWKARDLLDVEVDVEDRRITDYHADAAVFKVDMRQLAADLRRAGA